MSAIDDIAIDLNRMEATVPKSIGEKYARKLLQQKLYETTNFKSWYCYIDRSDKNPTYYKFELLNGYYSRAKAGVIW